MQYRPEIDGLRAVAVLPVVFFHAGWRGFGGGYVGVDVFFVISGYLITSILMQECQAGNFSIWRFYERRARRILPALITVLAVSTLAAYIFLPSDLLQAYSQSLASVALFSSNIFYWLTNGYFSTASEQKPLLHTWSLAVEEQYYLFFPLLVSWLWRFGKKTVFLCIGLLSLASFAWCLVLIARQSWDANFYLLFSRAWELFAGSLVAGSTLGFSFLRGAKVREGLGLLGLGLIAFSVAWMDKDTPYPGLHTLVPVLGTCLFILFGNASTLAGRLLSAPVMVFIGGISYSMYLWHQPLFAFLRLTSVGEPEPRFFWLAIAAVFLLSLLSWKWVEKPFRAKNAFSRAAIFGYALASILIMNGIAAAGYLFHGFPGRFQADDYSGSMLSSPLRDSCSTRGARYLKPRDACRYFGDKAEWATFGDSHTIELAYALALRLRPSGRALVQLSFHGCPPALTMEVKDPGCKDWINESLAYLESHPEIENVVVGFRYSAFFYGDQLADFPRLPHKDPRRQFTAAYLAGMKEDPRDIYWRDFAAILRRLKETGKTVYVIYPVPELPLDIHQAVHPKTVFGSQTKIDLEKSSTSDYYRRRNAFILAKLDGLPYGPQMHAIKPFDLFCGRDYCPAVKEGQALYFDDDHMSLAGAGIIAEAILSQVPESPGDPPK